MQTITLDLDVSKAAHTNGSPIGLYMHPSTASDLLAKSKAIRKHVLLVRQVTAERGPLVERGADRRSFDTVQDLLDFADRRHGDRRFDRTSL